MTSRYIGKSDRPAGDPVTGILIANTGSPAAPTYGAVRRYLRQFLSDPRVIEVPRAVWLPVLHGIILNTRPIRISRAYASIWRTEAEHGESGSPLILTSERQRALLEDRLTPHFAGPVKVAMGMAYGEPSIPVALEDLRHADVRRLLVFPLYPQYSASTTGAIFDAVTTALRRWRWIPELRFSIGYYEHPGYIQALADSVRAYWDQHDQPDRLIISYHSLPKRYFENGDPYYYHCRTTTHRLVEALNLPAERWMLTFQSPFGPIEWIDPFLEDALEALPPQGIRSVQVICPSFAADCLETLEEVAIEGRETFLHAGGETFGYIPALNDSPDHIAALVDAIMQQTGDWQTVASDPVYEWRLDH